MNSNENINRIKFHPWVEEGEKNPLKKAYLIDLSWWIDTQTKLSLNWGSKIETLGWRWIEPLIIRYFKTISLPSLCIKTREKKSWMCFLSECNDQCRAGKISADLPANIIR